MRLISGPCFMFVLRFVLKGISSENGNRKQRKIKEKNVSCSLLISLFFLMATPLAYGSSWARGQIGAAAAGLRHSHSHVVSEPHLRPTPQAHGNARSLTH